ncbi:MAG TPA: PH domain-containing protein [Acidimicrobiales bacterium]|nr:PH domain-containing protein [Acidimicrobiales bacterium]
MTYPKRHLLDGETIVDERGTHPIKLAPSLFALLVIFSALGVGFVFWKNAPTWFGIALGVVFLSALVYLYAKLLIFRSTQVVLTSQRLIYRSGIFKRISRDIPLGSIVDLVSRQTLFKRVVGVGDVELRINAQNEPVVLRDLSQPKRLVALTHGAVESLERSRVSAAIAGSEPLDLTREYRRLIALQRKGVITLHELVDQARSLGIDHVAKNVEATDT